MCVALTEAVRRPIELRYLPGTHLQLGGALVAAEVLASVRQHTCKVQVLVFILRLSFAC